MTVKHRRDNMTDATYQTISLPLSTEMTTETFLAIVDEMVGSRDQHSVAAALDISQSSASNFMRGTKISNRSGNKIAAAWNAFVETGVAPKRDSGDIDDSASDDGNRPFVAVNNVPVVRERASGQFFRRDHVEAGLVGSPETDDEVVARISGRFGVMTNIVRRMLRRKLNSMIVRAAPGVGKTYTIERELRAHKTANEKFEFSVLSGGGVSAFALYKALYKARNGGVVVLDDNDSFLDADETLNMLKNALDSSEIRTLTWSKKNSEVFDVDFEGEDEEDSKIPSRFEFNGAMIFITNLDFQAIAQSGSARSAHVAAMIDRSWYVNLTINNLRDKMLWCEHVFMEHMYAKQGLSLAQANEIVAYVKENATKFFILSLRLFKDIGELAADTDGGDWQEIVEATKFKA